MDEITDGIDARKIGLHLFVDAYAPAIVVESLFDQLLQSAGVGAPTDCDQDILGRVALLSLAGGGDDLLPAILVFDAFDLCARDDFDTSLAQDTHQQAAYFVIDGGEDVR